MNALEKLLTRLEDDTNEAINAQRDDPDMNDQAVNWGDLKCNEARLVFTSEGESNFQVCIDEASPDAGKFRSAIAGYLLGKDWGHVDVILEW